MPADETSVFDAVLDVLPCDVAAHFGWEASEVEIVAAHERPTSYIARVRVRGQQASGAPRYLFVKIFKDVTASSGGVAMRERVQHEFATMQRVYAAMARFTDLGVVPPVACYPAALATVTEEVKGPTLLEYLPRRIAWWSTPRSVREAAETMRATGRWLRAVQTVDPPGPTLAIDELSEYVDVRLARLVAANRARFTQAWRDRILRQIAALGAQIPPSELFQLLAHADMALANVLVDGTRIVVLDFAMARRALRMHDLARLSLQLDLLAVKPHIRPSAIPQLQRALLHGYEPGLEMGHPMFRLLSLLHRVNHLGSLTLRPAPWHQAMYNRLVAHAHERWIARELASEATR